MKIIEERASISPDVEKAVKAAVDSSYYVEVHTVVLTNIDFTDAFEKVVEEKMIAEQEKLKAEYEKEKAIIKAEQELETAKLQADAKLYAAQQDAEAKKAVALAEAVATSSKIAKLAESLGYKVETICALEERTEVKIQQVQKLDANGKPITGEDGKPIYEDKEVEIPYKNPDRADGLWISDVVAGYEIEWDKDDTEGKQLILEYLKYL